MAVQNYATYDVVSLDSIVAAAKMRLGIRDSNENDLFLKDLAIEGFKKIGAVRSYVQRDAVLPIDNYRAQLPADFVMLNRYNGVVFVGADGQADYGIGGVVPSNTNAPFISNSPISQPYRDRANFQIQQGYIWFDNSVSSDYVAISYLGVAQDENGDIIIPEVYQLAIIPYLCWQFCLTNAMPQTQSWEGQYKTNIKAVRGRVNMPDAAQNQLLAYKMNTIL
jgi:hypothetical protein